MDILKITEELDLLYENELYNKIENFLLSKMNEAEKEKNYNLKLALANELIGLYRSSSRFNEAIILCDNVIKLMNEMGIEKTINYATILLNVATVYRETGRIDEALTYYCNVFEIFNDNLSEDDMRLASLYNNMSLSYNEKRDYEKAFKLLEKALLIVTQNQNARIEEAITHSNIAISLIKMNRVNEAIKHIEVSLNIFIKTNNQKDFHYAATLSAMGDAQYMLKNYEKSLEYYYKSLLVTKNTVGKNSYYAITCSNIALTYDKLNNIEKKEEYASMSEDINSKLRS